MRVRQGWGQEGRAQAGSPIYTRSIDLIHAHLFPLSFLVLEEDKTGRDDVWLVTQALR